MRSPAPPVVALVGLFGIIMGEQIIRVAKHMLDGYLQLYRSILKAEPIAA